MWNVIHIYTQKVFYNKEHLIWKLFRNFELKDNALLRSGQVIRWKHSVISPGWTPEFTRRLFKGVAPKINSDDMPSSKQVFGSLSLPYFDEGRLNVRGTRTCTITEPESLSVTQSVKQQKQNALFSTRMNVIVEWQCRYIVRMEIS